MLARETVPVRKQQQQSRRELLAATPAVCCTVEPKSYPLLHVDGSQIRGRDGKLSTLTIKCEAVPEDGSSEARKAALKSPLVKDVHNKVRLLHTKINTF
jgi:hypothetical protein